MAKIAHKFDPFELVGEEKPRNHRAISREICDFVLEEVLNHVGDAKSPVRNGKWKSSLSKEYKKQKSKKSGILKANMELSGDMLDAMECVLTSDGQVELRIDGKEGDKADGHNNHSGRSNLPAREFIPKPDQTFKRGIVAGIKQIIKESQDG